LLLALYFFITILTSRSITGESAYLVIMKYSVLTIAIIAFAIYLILDKKSYVDSN